MPEPPKPSDPNRRIDPSRQGDGRANRPPTGRPEQPLHNGDGRIIAPGRDRLGGIDRGDIRRNIRDRQDRWDRNDHAYHWEDWNGMRVCHRYDEFGFHWWGFYIGDAYFWTRYYDDNYWWYDPYWHRWDALHDGQWWWQGPDGTIYVYTDGGYYQYGNGDSGVVMTPDPTPPVDTPPGSPNAPANQTTVYSLDGTRSVQILGDGRDAYLYDLTVQDASDPRAQARWLAAGVAGVKFVATDPDASGAAQAPRQIELTFDDPSVFSVTDPNGERKVEVSGDDHGALLYNLTDSGVDPLLLATGVTKVTLFNQETQDSAGEYVQSLRLIHLTVLDAAGNEAARPFDRDGAPVSGALMPFPPSTRRLPPPSVSNGVETLRRNMQRSETFSALKSGAGW